MGQPAARLTDPHLCPMVTGVVPHVGGPIIAPGMPTVLIGGLPAARVSDMCACVGPPDAIVQGSATVLIGGLMAARMGDMCIHGGPIVMGDPTVLIGDAGSAGGAIQNALATLGDLESIVGQMATEYAENLGIDELLGAATEAAEAVAPRIANVITSLTKNTSISDVENFVVSDEASIPILNIGIGVVLAVETDAMDPKPGQNWMTVAQDVSTAVGEGAVDSIIDLLIDVPLTAATGPVGAAVIGTAVDTAANMAIDTGINYAGEGIDDGFEWVAKW